MCFPSSTLAWSHHHPFLSTYAASHSLHIGRSSLPKIIFLWVVGLFSLDFSFLSILSSPIFSSSPLSSLKYYQLFSGLLSSSGDGSYIVLHFWFLFALTSLKIFSKLSCHIQSQAVHGAIGGNRHIEVIHLLTIYRSISWEMCFWDVPT